MTEVIEFHEDPDPGDVSDWVKQEQARLKAESVAAVAGALTLKETVEQAAA